MGISYSTQSECFVLCAWFGGVGERFKAPHRQEERGQERGMCVCMCACARYELLACIVCLQAF